MILSNVTVCYKKKAETWELHNNTSVLKMSLLFLKAEEL